MSQKRERKTQARKQKLAKQKRGVTQGKKQWLTIQSHGEANKNLTHVLRTSAAKKLKAKNMQLASSHTQWESSAPESSNESLSRALELMANPSEKT